MSLFPNNWKIEPVNKLCSEIIDCINKTAPTVDFETEYKMIRTTNVRHGRVDLEVSKKVDEKTFKKWTRRVLPKKKDIILTREAPLGEIGLIRTGEKAFLGQRTVLYRANKNVLDQIFLYYSFQGFSLQAQIKSLGSGSTVEHLRVPHAETLKIPFPPLPIQKKIAAVLAAYDDLIENNNRRIAILEKMAEEVYKEWFVRLRFPGHQTAKSTKGIPEGWEVKPSNEIFKIMSGGTPKTNIESYWNGKIPFFTPKDVETNFYTLFTEKYITESGLKKCNSKLYPKNTIFITARGTVGKIALSASNMAMNQSCYALIPKSSEEIYFYFLALKSSINVIKGVSKSGVFDNIIVDTFNAITLLVPNVYFIQSFNKKLKPLFEELLIYQKMIINLKQTRDRLLTRLISGKLSVENLDIHFPPSMKE